METNVIAQNLKRIRQLKGWTQDQVAKSLGITKGAVSNHENNQRVLNVIDIEKYANLYGVLPGTLFDVNFNEDNVSRFSLIHLLNEVQAGMFTDINEINCMETDMFPVDSVYAQCFALTVKDNSMNPEYLDGDILVINPYIQPTSGDLVIACNEVESKATFKKYRERYENGQMYFELVPLNPDFPILSSRDIPFKIKGVLVAFFRSVRR